MNEFPSSLPVSSQMFGDIQKEENVNSFEMKLGQNVTLIGENCIFKQEGGKYPFVLNLFFFFLSPS